MIKIIHSITRYYKELNDINQAIDQRYEYKLESKEEINSHKKID